MGKVKFVGTEDFRILDGNDLHRHAEVKGFHKTEFARGVEVEVPDDVAQALVNGPSIFGLFEYVEGKETLDFEEEAQGKPEEEGNPERSNGPLVDAPSKKAPAAKG